MRKVDVVPVSGVYVSEDWMVYEVYAGRRRRMNGQDP